MKQSSTLLFIYGAVSILFGIIAAAWPISTLVTLVVLWGIFALADGITALIGAFRPEAGSLRKWMIFNGIIGVLAAAFAIIHPLAGMTALVWVVGIWLIARGAGQIASAVIVAGSNDKIMLGLGGVLWVILGGIFIANPGSGALTITLWAGIMAVISGIFLIAVGFAARKNQSVAG